MLADAKCTLTIVVLSNVDVTKNCSKHSSPTSKWIKTSFGKYLKLHYVCSVKLTVTKHLYIGSLVFTFFQDIIYYFCATRHTVVLLNQLSLFVFVCILYMDGWGTETLTFLLQLTEKSCETQKKVFSIVLAGCNNNFHRH